MIFRQFYHHGIQGQKWGVRRFTNPDGSLTEEGKKRYGKDTALTRDAAKMRDDFNQQKSRQLKEDTATSALVSSILAGGIGAATSHALRTDLKTGALITAGATIVGGIIGGAAGAYGIKKSQKKADARYDYNENYYLNSPNHSIPEVLPDYLF